MYVEITAGPIDVGVLSAHVGHRQDGATLIFLGVVRDHNEGKSVAGMEYEAYEEMAAEVLNMIAREASDLLGTERVAVIHRIGVLTVGDTSVGIAVSSPHREQAYDASRYVIEEIKKRLPIWKQEHYADGERSWVRGHHPPVESPIAGGPA